MRVSQLWVGTVRYVRVVGAVLLYEHREESGWWESVREDVCMGVGVWVGDDVKVDGCEQYEHEHLLLSLFSLL
jgi:hypothetical protein